MQGDDSLNVELSPYRRRSGCKDVNPPPSLEKGRGTAIEENVGILG